MAKQATVPADLQQTVRIERDMVQALERHFSGKSCLREFDSGNGRADLIVADVDRQACAERSASGLEPLDDEALLRLLDGLSDAPMRAAAVALAESMSTSYARRLLGRLVSAGFVERTQGGYRRTFTPPSVLRGIVAIEAKVRDWQAGLFQSRRYLRYSNTVYLALASQHLGRVDLAALAQEGIGLLSIDASGVVVEVLAPTTREPNDVASRALANEAVWRQITTG